MSYERFTTSRPDAWNEPRPFSDPTIRRMKHGPIVPMQEPSWFARLIGA